MIDPKRLLEELDAAIVDIDKEMEGLRLRTQELNKLRVNLDSIKRRADVPVTMETPK